MPSFEPRIAQNYSVPLTSPVVTAITTLGTSSLAVIGANPTRKKLTFHNPNVISNINIFVCPSSIPAVVAGGGSICIFPGWSVDIEGNCGFNAIAQSGANNGLTILEYV